MADEAAASGERRQQLTQDFLAQTARIPFAELQRYFAAGQVIEVGPSLDLVEVAVELSLDNTERFGTWTADGSVAVLGDQRALEWIDADKALWAVVADPWVLVQDRPSA